MRACRRAPADWLTPAAWVAAVTAVLLLVFPVGFPNYDTIYALVWGRELAHGVSPDYGAALPPTPHPLADLLGLVTTPLGDGAITVTMVVAYAALGLIGFLVYRLGTIWFDRWIGILAAAFVLTRAPFLSNGLRAYIDLPYIALCLGALTIEAKRPRAGWPVLALLVPAGLLRPEAWLFAGVYWLYLAFDVGRDGTKSAAWQREIVPLGRRMVGALGLGGALAGGAGARGARLAGGARRRRAAALGPVRRDHHRPSALLMTGTQETVETLKRKTGPVDLVLYGPRALGEVMQWPGMVGALGGVILGFAFLRRRSALGIAASSSPSAPSPCSRCARPRDHRPLHDARRGDPGDLRRRSPCSAGACSTPSHPWRRALAALRRPRRADVRDLAAEPVGPRLHASTPT